MNAMIPTTPEPTATPPPKRKRGRANDAELASRIEQVLSLRLNGALLYDLKSYADKAGWNVSERQLWRYVAESDKILAKAIETDRQKLLSRHLAQRHSLYARAIQADDLKTAMAVLKDTADLEGLYPAKGIKLQGDRDAPLIVETLTDADRQAAIASIVARFVADTPGSAGSTAEDCGRKANEA